MRRWTSPPHAPLGVKDSVWHCYAIAEPKAETRHRLSRLSGLRLSLEAPGGRQPREAIATVTTEEFNRIMMTNALGSMRVVEASADLVPPNGVMG